MAYRSIADRLSIAETTFTNVAQDPDLAGPLAEFGYDTDRMQEGETLFQEARDAFQEQVRQYGEQYDATERVQRAYESAQEEYRAFVRVARVALRDRDGLGAVLDLSGTRNRSLSGGLEQMRLFYQNALGDDQILDALALFNVTPEKLEEAQRRLDTVATLRAEQSSESGEAQDATKIRDAAMQELDAWMRDFQDIARVAFTDRPQFLEKMGMLARS